MEKQHKTPYLFLLQRPSFPARREAAKRLRELGMIVVAQYGQVAIEALATTTQSEAAQDLGVFQAGLKGAMLKEHMKRLTPEQLQVVQQWNTRFTESYRNLKKDQTHRNKSWGSPGLDEPFPYTAIGEEEFKQLVAQYEERTGQSLLDTSPKQSKKGKGAKRRPNNKPMSSKEFVDYERRLRETYGNANLAYHLSRLALRLGPRFYELMLHLPNDIVKALDDFFDEADCWKMNGEIAVGIVFVESSRAGGPKFGNTERDEICQEILDGHSWLTSEHPEGNLSWVYDFQFINIDVADGEDIPDNCPSLSSLEPGWANPAMGQVSYGGNTYSADTAGRNAYREDMRQNNLAAHAIVIFVTPFANCWHAYAGGRRIVLAKRNDWGGWGRSSIARIAAHETCHLFGAADEYGGTSGTPCPSCDTTHGCDNIPNGNCEACAAPHQLCAMGANSLRLCAYTRGQLGWADLFVETTTGDINWAGTDDDVQLDIGDRRFDLDTPDHDDRERGNREGYALFAGGLRREEIKRILIRKSPDGSAGGWRLKRVRVWHQGDLICDVNNVNQWLEDNRRWWVGCITESINLVSRLKVKITTADVGWAGTDDTVVLTLAGRSWELDNPGHDDFERGNTDTFDLDPDVGFYVSDIRSVRITKSPDGVAGGWKLKGVEIIVNGESIYNKQSINKWLEDDDRAWSDII
jgi:PLAT/LH2 domain